MIKDAFDMWSMFRRQPSFYICIEHIEILYNVI